jgi:hypothetical protein
MAEENPTNETQPGVAPITEATPEGYAVTPEQHDRNALWQTGNVATNGAGPTITEVSHVFDEARAAAFGLVKNVEEDVKEEVDKVEGKKAAPAKSTPAKAEAPKPGDEVKKDDASEGK